MRKRLSSPRRAALVATSVVAAILTIATAAPAGAREARRPDPSGVQVLQTGLNSPKGLDSFLGIPIISQGAFGPEGPGEPGPVVAWLKTWRGSTLKNLTAPISLVDVAVGPFLTMWGLGTDQMLYRRTLWNPNFVKVADIPAYQMTDPDPTDLEDDPTESNPYGLASLPNGDALVADAANNDLLRITPKGNITTVARFAPEMVKTDMVPPADGPTEGAPEGPLPPEIPAEAVPTSIAVTPHGVLVGELKGFPFRPGSSRIWKVDPNANGALCSAAPAPSLSSLSSRGCSEFASGFDSIQDVAYNPYTRSVYVYEFAEGGVGAFEAGLGSGNFPPAVLIEINRNGSRRELAAGQLSQPGGITVSLFGQLFATDGVFSSGRLLKVNS